MRLIQNPREPWFYILDMYTCRFPCSMQLFSSVMYSVRQSTPDRGETNSEEAWRRTSRRAVKFQRNVRGFLDPTYKFSTRYSARDVREHLQEGA